MSSGTGKNAADAAVADSLAQQPEKPIEIVGGSRPMVSDDTGTPGDGEERNGQDFPCGFLKKLKFLENFASQIPEKYVRTSP